MLSNDRGRRGCNRPASAISSDLTIITERLRKAQHCIEDFRLMLMQASLSTNDLVRIDAQTLTNWLPSTVAELLGGRP